MVLSLVLDLGDTPVAVCGIYVSGYVAVHKSVGFMMFESGACDLECTMVWLVAS